MNRHIRFSDPASPGFVFGFVRPAGVPRGRIENPSLEVAGERRSLVRMMVFMLMFSACRPRDEGRQQDRGDPEQGAVDERGGQLHPLRLPNAELPILKRLRHSNRFRRIGSHRIRVIGQNSNAVKVNVSPSCLGSL